MAAAPVTLDFSKMQPIAPTKPNGGVTLDFSKAVPIQGAQPAPPKPAQPIGGDLRPTSFLDQITETRPDDPNEGIGERAVNFLGNIGASGMNAMRHPFDTFNSINPFNTLADTVRGQGEYQLKKTYDAANTRPVDTLAQGIGSAAVLGGVGEVAPRIAAPVLEKAGPKMQDAGAGMMNRTVGSLQKDFKRGADPGRAYLDAGGGPALSMDSLASKGTSLKNATGAKLGSLYDSATQDGVTIPASKISAAINPPIENARAIINGPGGTGNTVPLDNFADSFKPSLYPRVNTGATSGLTPNDVFAMKKNVSANTNWSDPTQFGMKKVQQQTAGALGGVLTDTLPETAPLNSQYQGLTNFTNRAGLRAQSGSMPLSSIVRRAGEGLLGATLGYTTHNPMISAGAGLGSMALESIPARTTAASLLYQGGRGAAAIGSKLRSLY